MITESIVIPENRWENKDAIICGTVNKESNNITPTILMERTIPAAIKIIIIFSIYFTAIPFVLANSRSNATYRIS